MLSHRRRDVQARRTSGVSAGQSMPHWLGCSERGPETLRVFSNWELILVIMPSAATKDSRDRTCTPPRSAPLLEGPSQCLCSLEDRSLECAGCKELTGMC